MRRPSVRRSAARRARFEQCEDRLVFSSVPIPGLCGDAQPELTTPQPDWVDAEQLGELAPLSSQWSAAAAYVRDTFGLVGTGQTVAVIDSGIAYDHRALGGGFGAGYQVVGGWDFTEENDANPYDDGPAGYHGTHVAGIIASRDAVRSGVAPGVDLVALRVFNDYGVGYLAWVERALNWVYEHRNDFRYPITTVNLSLGSNWNGSLPPSWATLEEELARLASVGIFVSAAAGNRFQEYVTPGLAYPAASPHAIPVASVGADGALSRFSQRDPRVIAAPGERVTSTVPDHIYGGGGNFNDWATLSGTSMAAPYLAGASVLVREAMQFVGMTSVNQWDIYQHLRGTADRVFDPITATHYFRVNLARAVDAVLPADDYGSVISQAHNLGTLARSQTVSGHISRLDDLDYFQFTAAASGHLSVGVQASSPVNVSLVSPTLVEQIDRVERFQVEKGKTYTLVVSSRGQLAHYDLQLNLAAQQQVQTSAGHIYVTGTSGDDHIRLSVGAFFQLQVNQQSYYFSRRVPWTFTIVGGGGRDTLTVSGGDYSGLKTQPGGQAQWTGSGYQLSAAGFQQINLLPQGGGAQVVRLAEQSWLAALGTVGSSASDAYGPQLPVSGWSIAPVSTRSLAWSVAPRDMLPTTTCHSPFEPVQEHAAAVRTAPLDSHATPLSEADPYDWSQHATESEYLHIAPARSAPNLFIDVLEELFAQLGE